MQTGVLPPFVPFAQAFAAVITAALTGSLYYVAASPKGDFFNTDILLVMILFSVLCLPRWKVNNLIYYLSLCD